MTFAILFKQNCAACHGADGKQGAGPPLDDPLFRALIREEELREVLDHGRSGTLMPAFAKENGGTLTAAQIQVLIHEIKGIPYKVSREGEDTNPRFKVVRDPEGTPPQWGVPAKVASSVPPYLAPEAKPGLTSAELEKIRTTLFVPACAKCHGDQGQGAQNEGHSEGHPVAAINDPVFLSLISDQALRRYILTGRPDLGMPDYAARTGRTDTYKPLTSQQITDLVALLASWRQGGSTPSK
jgi:mono/diheme cytochrome c family protein